MRKQGRKSKYSKELIEKVVKEYLESDLTLEEVGAKYGMKKNAVQYHVDKEKKKNDK